MPESFDVVYAHLSLHYFPYDMTVRIFNEIEHVVKSGGIFAFFVNSTSDPQHGTGEKIEDDFYMIDGKSKRFVSVAIAQKLTAHFETLLLDDKGETYKDRAKGVHNLIRYVGRKQT